MSSLKACGEERLQQGLMVHALVEVITLDLQHILRKGLGFSVNILGFVELMCHIALKKTQ